MAAKTSLIMAIFVMTMLLVLWATQLMFHRPRQRSTQYIKFGGAGYLEHSESSKWSPDWITQSSVCPFGKAMGMLFVVYALVVIVAYPTLRANASKIKKDKVDSWFFWVTLLFLVFAFFCALALNVPLFVRLLPAMSLMIIALIVLKTWENK